MSSSEMSDRELPSAKAVDLVHQWLGDIEELTVIPTARRSELIETLLHDADRAVASAEAMEVFEAVCMPAAVTYAMWLDGCDMDSFSAWLDDVSPGDFA